MGIGTPVTNTYSDSSGSLSVHPINLPAGFSAGDKLTIFAAFHGSVTVTTPSGWTALIATKVNTDTFVMFGRDADGSEGSTVSVTISGNARSSAVAISVPGARTGFTSSEVAVSSAVDANTATPNPPNLTPSWGSDESLWIAVSFAADGSFTFSSYPTNYSLAQANVQTGTGTGNAVMTAARILTASSEDPGVFTTVTSRTRSTYTLAIRASALVPKSLATDAGAFTVNAQAIGFLRSRLLSLTAASYAVNAQAITLKRTRLFPVAAAAYTINAQAIGFLKGKRLFVDVAAYLVNAQAITLSRTIRKLAAVSSAFTINGQAVLLIRSRPLAMGTAAYLVNEQPLTMRRGRALSVAAASFLVSGQALTMLRGKSLPLLVANFQINEQAITFRRTRRFSIDAPAYFINAQSVGFFLIPKANPDITALYNKGFGKKRFWTAARARDRRNGIP